MALAKSQRSLKAWGNRNGERNQARSLRKLENGIYQRRLSKSLSSAEYAATTRAKRRGTKRANNL